MSDIPRLVPVWELLGSSRQEYVHTKPWKAARMTRETYEATLLGLPHEELSAYRLANHAERLVREIFTP